MHRITLIAGVRSNFMKIAPLICVIQKVEQEGKKVRYRLVACTIGTNELIGTNPENIKPALDKLFGGTMEKGLHSTTLGRACCKSDCGNLV